MLKVGSIVIYHSAPAKIEAFEKGKLTIKPEQGDTRNVREKDIDFELHPGPGTFPLSLPETPDLAETAELLQGETLSFADFTAFLFGSYTPGNAYAAWKLIREGIHFRFEGENVTLRSPEEIAVAEEAIRAKNEAKERHAALLERIRKGEVTPEDHPFLAEIEQVALGINSASRLLKELGIEAIPEKAHKLLLQLGVWDLTRNPLPARAGVEMSDPDFELGTEPVYPEEREDLTHLDAYAIDDAFSHDPDDAISYVDGLLYVHVADPASVIAFDSAIDREARSRGENLYIPERVVHMLPFAATTQFCLDLQEASPAITFVIRFLESGDVELVKCMLTRISVKQRTYEEAAELLDKWSELRDKLNLFKEFRKENGALFIRMPEVKILFDQTGELRFIPCPVTEEREFVANCMLAAGAATAKWTVANEIPMPYVRQESPESPQEQSDSLPAMYALRRGCRPGVTDTTPGLHAGLGLEPYTRVTSPLRRYTDLLSHIQLHRYFAGEELLTDDELTTALNESEDAAAIRRKLERLTNEYWTLVHFHRHAEDLTPDAILVHRQDDRSVFLLPEYAYEYKSRFRGGLLGDWFQCGILSSDPARFTLRMKMSGIPEEEYDDEEETTEVHDENTP